MPLRRRTSRGLDTDRAACGAAGLPRFSRARRPHDRADDRCLFHAAISPRPARFRLSFLIRACVRACSFDSSGNPMVRSKHLLVHSSTFAILFFAGPAIAQGIGKTLQPEYVIVTGERSQGADPSASDLQVSAAKAQEQINTVNTEDMLKYAPSLIVRKRHYGDTQDPIATRTSGLGASARNLIFVDGIMVNSPIGNNNSAASPHFGGAPPRDISQIEVVYGPFAARYAGNAIGVTLNIMTRMPDHFELYGDATGALQAFHLYGTDSTPGTWQLAGGIGDRYGAFSWRLSENHLDSTGQPL